jgi:hypothetical protein
VAATSTAAMLAQRIGHGCHQSASPQVCQTGRDATPAEHLAQPTSNHRGYTVGVDWAISAVCTAPQDREHLVM